MMFRISHRLFYFHRTNFAVFSAVFLSSDDLIGLDLKVIFFPDFSFFQVSFVVFAFLIVFARFQFFFFPIA